MKSMFYEQQLLAMHIAKIFDPEVRKRLSGNSCSLYTMTKNSIQTDFSEGFPTVEKIYSQQIVMENDPEGKYYTKNKKKYE